MGRNLRLCATSATTPAVCAPITLYAGDSETNLIDQMLQRIRKQST